MAASGSTYLSRVHEKQVVREHSTSDGRYIPHSGGLMGWHENQGVLHCEIPNNYKYYSVIQADEVRAKLFARWNDGEKISRRASTRTEQSRQVGIAIVWNGQTAKGQLRDYSSIGMRATIQQQELSLEKGSKPTLRIMKSTDSNEVEFEATSEIMWINRTGRDRVIWSIGMMFIDISPQESARLKNFLK